MSLREVVAARSVSPIPMLDDQSILWVGCGGGGSCATVCVGREGGHPVQLYKTIKIAKAVEKSKSMVIWEYLI